MKAGVTTGVHKSYDCGPLMADQTTEPREELLKQFLALQASPQVKELAEKIIEANKSFDEELDRCLTVDTAVLRRKITV